MEVTYNDRIEKSLGTDVVTVVVEPDRATSRVKGNRQAVTVQNSYDISPSKTRLTVNYTVPQALINGWTTDVSTLQNYISDLNVEVGLVSDTLYSNDGVVQTLATLGASTVKSADLQSEVQSLDFSLAKIVPGGATFQEINSNLAVVQDNQASLVEDVQIQANNYGSAVSRLQTLEASSGEYSAKLIELATVAAGKWQEWQGSVTTGALSESYIGYVAFTTTNSYPNGATFGDGNLAPYTTDAEGNQIYAPTDGSGNFYYLWQYLGVGLGNPATGYWQQIEDVEGTFGAAKSIYTDSDGNITGWSYKGGSGDHSEFNILADTFKVANGNVALPVFVVDTTPGSEKVTFSSDVEIDGSLLVDGSVTADSIATGTITATQIATGTITADEINIDNLFAQDITATGTITGATLIGGVINGATGTFSGELTTPVLGNTNVVIRTHNDTFAKLLYLTTISMSIGLLNGYIELYHDTNITRTGATIKISGTYTRADPGDTGSFSFSLDSGASWISVPVVFENSASTVGSINYVAPNIIFAAGTDTIWYKLATTESAAEINFETLVINSG